MADHNKPVLTSTYANFVSELDARFDDLALGLDPAVTSATNLPVNTLRWNSVLAKDQKWNGSTWVDKSTFYALNSVRFNNGTATTPSVTFNDDTTTGISKPTASTLAISTAGVQRASFSSTGLSLASNLDFTGTGNRITGDFSNTRPVDRLMFQSSVLNGDTFLGVIPNGASSTAQVDVYSSSNLTNSSLGQIVATASDVRLVSGIIGAGSYLPLNFFTSGIQRLRIDTSGNSSFQGAVSAASLATSGSLNFTEAGNRITGDFSNAVLSNRLSFQTNIPNGSSEVPVIPNGTGNAAGFRAYSSSDVQNSSNVGIQSAVSEGIVEVSRTGTGNYLPLSVRTGGAEAFRVNVNQTVSDLKITEINGGQLAGHRNRIINGGMAVAQRGNVVLSNNSIVYGGADRWMTGLFSFTTAAGIVGQLAGQPVTSSSTGFMHSLSSLTTTGAGLIHFRQRIESVNAFGLNGKTVTVSGNVAQNTGVTQFLTVRLNKADSTDNFAGTMPIANSTTTTVASGVLTKFTATFDLASADASNGLELVLEYAGVGAFTSKSFYLGDVQLEIGAVATPFEHRPYGMELALCQRYYEVASHTDEGIFYMTATTAGIIYFQVQRFMVQKRALPTVSLTPQEVFGGFATSTITVGVVGIHGIRVNCISTSSSTISYFRTGWTASAEL